MLSTLPLSVAVRGPSAERRGWLCSDALREMPLKQWVKWPLKPGHCMMPPCPAEEPTLSCKMKKEEGGSWVLTIRQFFSVMKWSSQQGKSRPAGRTDGWQSHDWLWGWGLAAWLGEGEEGGLEGPHRPLMSSCCSWSLLLATCEGWKFGLDRELDLELVKKKITQVNQWVVGGMRKNVFKRKWPSTCRV